MSPSFSRGYRNYSHKRKNGRIMAVKIIVIVRNYLMQIWYRMWELMWSRRIKLWSLCNSVCDGVSQRPCYGPVPGLGINYTGPREVLLEFVILVFLSIFHEWIFYSRNILRRIIFLNVSKSYNTTICYKISLVQWLITN